MEQSNLYVSRLRTQEYQEIRLLDLRADAWNAPLRCTLRTVLLSESPPYEALSYVWGDAGIRRDIFVNSSIVSVTQKLEIALRNLRSQKSQRVLWIDALCINQQDVVERNQQVSIMGAVYASAYQVSIWLGEAQDDDNQAFDSLSTIAQGKVDEYARTEVCSFFAAVTNRPWFHRVWIIQELAMATQDPVVVCGQNSVPWSVFVTAWTTLSFGFFKELRMVRKASHNTTSENDATEEDEVVGKNKIDVLHEIRRTVKASNGETFRQLYIYSRTSEATEPRDRVYALLQMLSQEDRARFRIDYEKPISLVFTEAMAHIFHAGEGPHFLSSMWLHGGHSSIPGLPSWVIDFDAQTYEKTGQPGSISFHPPSPRSASGAGAAANNGKLLDDMMTLQVEVLPVDIVEEVVEFGENVTDCIAPLVEVEALVLKAKAKDLSTDPSRSFYQRFRVAEPLWSVLVSGRKYNSGYDAAPDFYSEMYSELYSKRQQWQETEEAENSTNEYRLSLEGHLPNRTFFITNRGLFGIGMSGMRPGDRIDIWFGAPVPFIMRCYEAPQEALHKLIGPSYVGGVMDGEMVDELYCEDLLDSETLLVT